MARKLDSAGAGFAAAFDALLAARRGVAADVDREAAAIVDAVRDGGDAVLLDYTARFDRIALTPGTVRLSPGEVADHAARAPNSVRDALMQAAERIEAFHRRLMPADLDYRDDAGVRLGARWRPLDAVGLYVPGGTAAYPSTVLMNAIPARVAGVQRIAMAVPTPDGAVDPAVMAAAEVAGVTEIYRVGGAQAVAALAYGTGTIAPVDKIVGPGNAYVAAAKRLVFGTVGIDMIAGPSEILVVADNANEPAWIAADLLSQAEHDEDAQAILITGRPCLRGQGGGGGNGASGTAAAHRHRGGELAPVRCRDRRALPRRGAAADQPPRAGAPGARGGGARSPGRGRDQRRRHLPRPPHAGKPSATTWPAPTTCCRRPAAPASPPASRRWTSSSARPSSAATPRASRRSARRP